MLSICQSNIWLLHSEAGRATQINSDAVWDIGTPAAHRTDDLLFLPPLRTENRSRRTPPAPFHAPAAAAAANSRISSKYIYTCKEEQQQEEKEEETLSSPLNWL